MTPYWLSRARLRRDAPVASLARLLVPDGTAARKAASHRLVWSLFADDPTRDRDFLWREERPGHFLTLSGREPADPHGLFELEIKAFEPVLAPGDRLGFALHANPTVLRPGEVGKRWKRHDVVMDMLTPVLRGERAERRLDVAMTAGRDWLARQGAAHGFEPDADVAVDGYETVRVPRDKGEPARFGVLDFQGRLTVRDPARFLAQLTQGFGRARAFGCGLMLIRRA